MVTISCLAVSCLAAVKRRQAWRWALLCGLVWLGPWAQADEKKPARPTEADFYAIAPLEIPRGEVIEVGALEAIPDGRLAVASRRGEIWMVSDPAGGAPRWQTWNHCCGSVCVTLATTRGAARDGGRRKVDRSP